MKIRSENKKAGKKKSSKIKKILIRRNEVEDAPYVSRLSVYTDWPGPWRERERERGSKRMEAVRRGGNSGVEGCRITMTVAEAVPFCSMPAQGLKNQSRAMGR